MFRPMRRANREIPEEAAKHLLKQSRRGVLAVNGDDGYPFAIPVNYFYDQEQDKIYFHGAKSGHKVDALKKTIRSALPFTAMSTLSRAIGPPMCRAQWSLAAAGWSRMQPPPRPACGNWD